jgi:SulP family sulfate permease
MSGSLDALAGRPTAHPASSLLAAFAASSVTIPHALGLGLLAFAPLAGDYSLAALALWSAALPGAVLALAAPRKGVVYAPTTIAALMYAAIVASVAGVAQPLGLSPGQVLAVCGATVALGCGFQWLFGFLRLASISRFLPLSVMHGFAAGVGLSMVLSQLTRGFGQGHWSWDLRLLLHAGVALAVMVLARLLQARWKQMPGLLPAVALVAVLVLVFGQHARLAPAVASMPFAWPPLPDWQGIPWLKLLDLQGTRLVSLAMLMALVNSLDILVFNQELDLEHGLGSEPNRGLRRESLIGAACGLLGMIPASTSASRSRIGLRQSGPTLAVGSSHAAIMLLVAVTGHWWLPSVPMACLAGALVLAGLNQVPRPMWSRSYARHAPAVWAQSWLVAIVFAVAGGAGALVAGLVVATFVLMHASASTALRRALLDGQLRSRRLRRSADDLWLAQHMQKMAVIELQGVMSFGVSAHMAEQVRQLLQPRHNLLIIDAARVAAWDATALVRLAALGRDLGQQGLRMAVCGFDERSAAAATDSGVRVFADLDRALEWAEEAMLAERAAHEWPEYAADEALGEIGEGVGATARASLEQQMRWETVAQGQEIFAAGDRDADLLVVQSGRVTLSTRWPPSAGLRLATVGQGMAFGEMAFLNGDPRTACAGAESDVVIVGRLGRARFDAWARAHPADALILMRNLAVIGTRRLGATTRQLRAVLE